MADAISIQELIDARTDAKTLEEAVNGDAVTTVLSRLGETYPTLSNALNQIDSKLDSADTQIKQGITNLFENGGLPATPFASKALMTASALVDGKYAMVTDDSVAANNGLYVKTAGAWVKSGYDPVAQAKTYTDSKTQGNAKLVTGKNLFDKTKVTAGYNLSVAGVPVVLAGSNISDFISVEPNTDYMFTAIGSVVFYDASKAFLRRTGSPSENVNSGNDAVYARVVVSNSSLDLAQVEKGAVRTTYEPYTTKLANNLVDSTSLKDKAVTESKIAPMSVTGEHLKGAIWLNMYDSTTTTPSMQLELANGIIEVSNPSIDLTAHIPCKPSTQYTASSFSRVFFYTKSGAFISVGTESTFITPANCYQLRFNLSKLTSGRFQLNEGATVPDIVQPHKYKMPQQVNSQTKSEINAVTARKYNFADAWYAWRNGDKFPIAILGDSTTNGNGTTGFVAREIPYDFTIDYTIATKAYPAVLQALLREATGNSVLRIYNAGFFGQALSWAAVNLDAILGNAYADAKMVGISMGINDRTASVQLYAFNFRRDLETVINWCLDKGKQPFLITTQPMTIPKQDATASMSDTEEIANGIRRSLANKYNLEIIDVNKYGQEFMQYSSKPLLNNIMQDGGNTIHFGNAGHQYTAELMFAHFCKRVIWTYNDGERLDYTTQLQKSDIYLDELSQLASPKQGFKNEVNKTQATATDKLYQDFYVFNAGRKQLDLTAYYANAAVGQYTVVNDVQTTITTQGQALGTLDLGLHKIKAYSSATTALDWLGFKLTPTA